MEKTIKLLIKCSEFRRHPNNQAREYALVGDKLYTIGSDCFIDTRNSKLFVREEQSMILINNYFLLYGISLTNVITFLKNKYIEILNLIRVSPKESYRETYYQIFTNFLRRDKYTSHLTIEYYESYGNDFKAFENSNLGQLLFDLYEIND